MSDIVIAPFSNSPIRDWPIERFAALAGRLIAFDAGWQVRIVGTANQRLAANEIVRPHPADRVVNACGRTGWKETLDGIARATCVIGNNSAIAHAAARLGVPTVCIFGGSHSRLEWRPRGRNVVVVSRAIGCSPCQLDHRRISPYGKACLREIAPEDVMRAIGLVMARARTGQEAGEAA